MKTLIYAAPAVKGLRVYGHYKKFISFSVERDTFISQHSWLGYFLEALRSKNLAVNLSEKIVQVQSPGAHPTTDLKIRIILNFSYLH